MNDVHKRLVLESLRSSLDIWESSAKGESLERSPLEGCSVMLAASKYTSRCSSYTEIIATYPGEYGSFIVYTEDKEYSVPTRVKMSLPIFVPTFFCPHRGEGFSNSIHAYTISVDIDIQSGEFLDVSAIRNKEKENQALAVLKLSRMLMILAEKNRCLRQEGTVDTLSFDKTLHNISCSLKKQIGATPNIALSALGILDRQSPPAKLIASFFSEQISVLALYSWTERMNSREYDDGDISVGQVIKKYKDKLKETPSSFGDLHQTIIDFLLGIAESEQERERFVSVLNGTSRFEPLKMGAEGIPVGYRVDKILKFSPENFSIILREGIRRIKEVRTKTTPTE